MTQGWDRLKSMKHFSSASHHKKRHVKIQPAWQAGSPYAENDETPHAYMHRHQTGPCAQVNGSLLDHGAVKEEQESPLQNFRAHAAPNSFLTCRAGSVGQQSVRKSKFDLPTKIKIRGTRGDVSVRLISAFRIQVKQDESCDDRTCPGILCHASVEFQQTLTNMAGHTYQNTGLQPFIVLLNNCFLPV